MSAIALSPDAALFLLLAGVWLVYLECNRPGWVVPGCAGCVLILISLWELSQYPASPLALPAILCSIVLLARAIFAPGRFLWLAAGTASFTAGLAFLVQPNAPLHVHPVAATVVGLGLAVPTVWLGRIALRARRNKLAAGRERPAVSGCTG